MIKKKLNRHHIRMLLERELYNLLEAVNDTQPQIDSLNKRDYTKKDVPEPSVTEIQKEIYTMFRNDVSFDIRPMKYKTEKLGDFEPKNTGMIILPKAAALLKKRKLISKYQGMIDGLYAVNYNKVERMQRMKELTKIRNAVDILYSYLVADDDGYHEPLLVSHTLGAASYWLVMGNLESKEDIKRFSRMLDIIEFEFNFLRGSAGPIF
jgi:hypothetical protein